MWIHAQQLQNENCERGLPTDILIKLADIHKTSVDYILNRTNNPKPII